jgi:REP element-mobilizing transposase RayT
MARRPRIHYPGAFYHVILRGNARQDIFFDESDRYRFYLLMQEGTERYRHRIHAFCLMTNHIHLLIQVADAPLSRIMQNLSFRYTRWSNWKQGKSGHLFQGRYKAVLVDADEYLLELVRYIHLNPVRAHMTTDPFDYRWSSHRAYCGKETIPWLCTDLTLSAFGKRKDIASRKFREFTLEGLGEGHRPEFHGGEGTDSRVLGDDSFSERVLAASEAIPARRIGIDEIILAVCRYYGITEKELRGNSHRSSRLRAMAAWVALETEGCTITELARLTGRDVTTLSCGARKLSEKAEMDDRLWEERRDIMKITSIQA